MPPEILILDLNILFNKKLIIAINDLPVVDPPLDKMNQRCKNFL